MAKNTQEPNNNKAAPQTPTPSAVPQENNAPTPAPAAGKKGEKKDAKKDTKGNDKQPAAKKNKDTPKNPDKSGSYFDETMAQWEAAQKLGEALVALRDSKTKKETKTEDKSDKEKPDTKPEDNNQQTTAADNNNQPAQASSAPPALPMTPGPESTVQPLALQENALGENSETSTKDSPAQTNDASEEKDETRTFGND